MTILTMYIAQGQWAAYLEDGPGPIAMGGSEAEAVEILKEMLS